MSGQVTALLCVLMIMALPATGWKKKTTVPQGCKVEDSGLWLIYDCQFSMFDLRDAPHWAVHQHAGQGRKRGTDLRDVKNEGTSGDVYENKGDGDKMSVAKQDFYVNMHELRDVRHPFGGLTGRKCLAYAIIRRGGGLRIGSSAHRFIDPSAEHRVGY
jgi:hypothetical protein